MTRIHRGEAPAILQQLSPNATSEICSRRDAGELNSEANPRIYGHEDVRRRLGETHANKCCYCEQTITRIDIEHFRPKARYYWLAYDWSNLLAACPTCNSKKLDRFGLKDESLRAIHHSDDLSREEPLFLNPAEDDPDEFIEFDRDIAKPRADGDLDRANYTIEKLGLNEPGILAARRSAWRSLRDLIIVLHDTDHPLALSMMRRRVQGAFAGMVRNELRRAPAIRQKLQQP